ncbi:endothelin-converting enzyme 2-like [Centruroides vittatus]|uniref:endothelin-converting enzyme 2-like n=1 Tax=Centruroides vittatus TaxID=120091 RepID=UPI00350EF173
MIENHGKFWRAENDHKSTNTILISVILLTILAILLLITLIMHSGFGYEPLNINKTCTSSHCVKLAMSIMQSMNTSADPCEDFYNFACGKWIERKVKEGIETSTFEDLHKRILIRFIERLEAQHFDWLKTYLKQFGGWPIIDEEWSKENYDWIQSIATATRKLEIFSILPVTVSYDSRDTSRNIIVIGQNDEPDKLSISQMINYIMAIAVYFGELPYTLIMEDIDKMLKLETKLSSMTEDVAVLANDYKIMTIRHLHELIPTINWLKMVQAITDGSSIVIDEDEPVVIKGINFLTDFGNLLNDKSFSFRNLANLVGAKVILKFLFPFLLALQSSLPVRGFNDDEHRLQQERAELCITELAEILTFAVDFIYIRSLAPQKGATDIIPYLFNAFRVIIRKSDWLDEQTKEYVETKLNEMIPIVNYPTWILNETQLDNFYDCLPEMTDNPLENFANLHEYIYKKSIALLRKRNIRNGWPVALRKSASTVGAFYVVEVNSIVIPRGFHNPPNFHIKNPRYMTYGSMGSGIGHEITHAFDNIGRFRDDQGRLRDLWTEHSKNEFAKRSQCFVDFYSKYGFSDVFVNGNLTLSENIADVGGLRQAYMAYKLWEKDHGREEKLPGLESFTTHQLFFISYGMNWCDSKNLNTLKESLMQDDHAPNKYRVLGTLSNMKEFSQVFKCKPNSNMNPTQKCVIW